MLNSLYGDSFSPSVFQACLGDASCSLLNTSLDSTPPFTCGKVALSLLPEQQLSHGVFKLNKELVLLSCRFAVAVCHPLPGCLLSAPSLPLSSVYIADVPLEALEANAPEQCQHEV